MAEEADIVGLAFVSEPCGEVNGFRPALESHLVDAVPQLRSNLEERTLVLLEHRRCASEGGGTHGATGGMSVAGRRCTCMSRET